MTPSQWAFLDEITFHLKYENKREQNHETLRQRAHIHYHCETAKTQKFRFPFECFVNHYFRYIHIYVFIWVCVCAALVVLLQKQ